MIDGRAAVALCEGAVPRLFDVESRSPVDDEVLVRVDAVAPAIPDLGRRGGLPVKAVVVMPPSP